MKFIKTLKDKKGNYLTDNINFTTMDGSFDPHRIFKLPNSVDMSTGILIKENLEKIRFNDRFIEI